MVEFISIKKNCTYIISNMTTVRWYYIYFSITFYCTLETLYSSKQSFSFNDFHERNTTRDIRIFKVTNQTALEMSNRIFRESCN